MQWKRFKKLFSWKEEKSLPLYALFSSQGNPLTLDPVTDRFEETTIRNLRVWDVQTFGDHTTWFMGNSPQPKVHFIIRVLTKKELRSLRIK